MKNYFVCIAVLLSGLLTACVSTATKQNSEKETELLGSDKDDHGCIASAGYIWSELLQNCIRPFEKGVKMTSVIDSGATSAAFLVFNSDSSRVELFLPNEEEQPILNRDSLLNGSVVWQATEEKESVYREAGLWTIGEGDRKIYREVVANADSVR